jgi:hypothetical protein
MSLSHLFTFSCHMIWIQILMQFDNFEEKAT